jgi:hypothetical protein
MGTPTAIQLRIRALAMMMTTDSPLKRTIGFRVHQITRHSPDERPSNGSIEKDCSGGIRRV